jgi:hypothetical protein
VAAARSDSVAVAVAQQQRNLRRPPSAPVLSVEKYHPRSAPLLLQLPQREHSPSDNGMMKIKRWCGRQQCLGALR